MSQRIPQVDPAVAEGRTREVFETVKKKFGMVPNALKTMAHSPVVLESYLSISGLLGHGVLPAPVREQIALAVSQANGCEYCLSAHTVTGKMSGLKPEQIVDARRGASRDPKSQAILNLTMNVLERRGNVSDEQLNDAKQAGLSNAEIVEVIGNVTLMILTNYINQLAQTDIDFPKVSLNA